MNQKVDNLRVKLFADGADLSSMIEMASKSHISGLTTNPTLMRKAGITNYASFAHSALKEIKEKPISFEVFSDNLEEMKVQAEKIASWANNVYVKIPITNTLGESTKPVIKYLTENNVKVNVTALMTLEQVKDVVSVLNPKVESFVSVFAGRIADTGIDPMPIMQRCVEALSINQKSELIWASPRELLNVFQADQIGCQIITATNEILAKLELCGRDLTQYSLETVRMFHNDAQTAGYVI